MQMGQDKEAFPQIQSVPQMRRLEHLLGREDVVVGADKLQFKQEKIKSNNSDCSFNTSRLLGLQDREDAEGRDREFSQLA